MTLPTSYTNQDKVFKSLQALAENDLDGFEAKREKVINEFINSIPLKYQERMQCFQWSIDRTRDLAKTPLDAYFAISNMMFSSANQLHDEAQSLQATFSGEKIDPHIVTKPEGRVLDFKVTCE